MYLPPVHLYTSVREQVPNTKFTVEGGKKARLNAAKLQRYSVLWELILRLVQDTDPDYAAIFTGRVALFCFCCDVCDSYVEELLLIKINSIVDFVGVAVTMGFTDSPHIDTENIGITLL